MKGSHIRLRWRGKELFLILIVLVCATILIWAWDRSPLLTSSLPPKNQLLQLSPDIKKLSSEPKIHVNKDISAPAQKNNINIEEVHNVDKVAPEDPNNKDIITVSSKSETDVNKHVSAVALKDNINKEEEQKWDKVAPEDPIKKDITSRVKGEELKHRQSREGEKYDDAESGSSLTRVERKNLTSERKIPEKKEQRVENQACNYAQGKWVVDDRRPLYSGFGCKQWLAPMWACRLMQRQDFAYEKLRWQPKNCQMEEFEGSKFLKRMQDKTLAFVGDSLGRQQFQSLMCMITGGKDTSDVIDVGEEYGLVIPPGGKRPNGWAYRFLSTNTTVLYYWSASLCDLEPINVIDPQTEYAMHLDRPPAFLKLFLHKFDVLVLNTGHHWNRGKLRANRWVMHVAGVPNTNRRLADMGGAKNFTVHSIVKWVDSQLPKHPRLKAFLRSISPRHFANGDWNTGGSCDNIIPMSVGKELLQEESSDYSAGSAVRNTRVKLLDITALSQLRDEGHISRFSSTATPGVHDCLHWCLPGVPDTWNEILFAQI